MNFRNYRATSLGRRTALAVAISLGAVSGAAVAQSNVTGSIFGSVGQQGTNVTVSSADTGFTRTIAVDSNGRYRFSALPPGNYKVTLENNGSVVSTRDNVTVTISGGSDVSFGSSASATEASTLEGVSVSASAMPSI
ncbi:MAG: carboxypeptidase-like regulatory domain-containing protein, partial [Luteibacter sp.]